MIIRGFQKGDAASRAWYSPCGVYRYRLERVWAPGALLACIMLNPSTATEERNDPTIERCERRARALGFGGLSVVNLFAFRATYPADLRRAADPVGPGMWRRCKRWRWPPGWFCAAGARMAICWGRAGWLRKICGVRGLRCIIWA